MMNKRMIIGLLVLASVIFSSQGCAAILSGTRQPISFTSEPIKAKVSVGDVQGITPTTLNVSKSAKTVIFSKEGYATQTVELQKSVKAGYILADILFTPGYGIIGLLVDGLSGAWNSLPPGVHCDFEEKVKQ